MNVSVNRGNLSPFGILIVKGSKLIVTDQNTMGKPLGVAEGSAKALEKTTAFGMPETVEQETIVTPEQTTVTVPDQSTILEGAVPVTENIGTYIPEQAFEVQPTSGVETVPGFAEEPKAVPIEMPVDVNEIPVADASGILMEDTGAIKQEDIVFENPETGQTIGIPEPQSLDTGVELTEDMFNVAATLPEDGKSIDINPNQSGTEVPNGGLVIDLPTYTPLPDDGKNINLNPDGTKNPGEGLVVDFPAVERMDTSMESIINNAELNPTQKTAEQIDKSMLSIINNAELNPTQKTVIQFKESLIKLIDEFVESLGDINNWKNVQSDKNIKEVLSTVDTSVTAGINRIQEAVRTSATSPAYGQVTDVSQQEVVPTALGM